MSNSCKDCICRKDNKCMRFPPSIGEFGNTVSGYPTIRYERVIPYKPTEIIYCYACFEYRRKK